MIPPGVPIAYGWATWTDCQTAYHGIESTGKGGNRMAQRPNRIRELREQKGITQEHLARMLGMAPAVLSRVETGERDPTAEQLKELVKFFQLEAIADLFVAPAQV